MSNFFSKELLNKVRTNNSFLNTLNESISEKKWMSHSHECNVFLSHKHSDIKILENVIFLLKNLNSSVYVDWNDEGMPSTTSRYTAMRIKQKIRECNKFILLATEDAIASKWCNWELGYGDAYHYINNIAIMPITEKTDDIFSGNEYLNIYPVIKSEFNHSSNFILWPKKST